ncbi:DUF3150 domain-containing protein [Caenimonas sedimenti]|uniref:DUF3150 domain-containing protein n=1 Tax=Caenimonas sedimenti TaxID=2596921 RepID=A0A562ZTK6_9BURK|nr:DUF3150 domain-containing protein [Caenimonas sedimenti]TWO71474.1 DUF3150 domain-containing protein [Caenimonas sedimenti]
MDKIHIKQIEANGLISVTLDVHLWSGRKRLRKEALLQKNPEFKNLPPESLATLGSIKIADPDDLAPFVRLKREAEKVLLGNGLPFIGRIGIPEAKLEKVYAKLTDLQNKFDALRTQLHRDFETRIQEWRDKDDNQDWAHLINDIPTPEYVAGRLAFGFHLSRVSAPSQKEGSPINENYGRQVTGLKGELFADAAREARLLMDRYLTGNKDGVVKPRDQIKQKTLGPLRRIAEKLRSFSFLDPTVEPMAEVVEHCLSLLPKEGPIDGVHLVHIWSLARTLANEKAAEEAAAIAFHLSSPGQAFEKVLSKASDTVTAPAVAVAPSPAPAPVHHAQGAADAVMDPVDGNDEFRPSLTSAMF